MRSLVTFINVEGLVLTVERKQVAGVHRASEPLETVVGIGNNLHVVDCCARSHSAHCQAVNLFINRKLKSSKADRNVAEDS